MNSPSETALSLVEKYGTIKMSTVDGIDTIFLTNKTAKDCALITVGEIIDSKPSVDFWDSASGMERRPNEEFWKQVKSEIEKL